MDLKYLIKAYWHLITVIITAVFIVGFYYMKIQYLEETVTKNSSEIESIKNKTYFILGILQKDYPNININEYAKAAKSNELSSQDAVTDLIKLKQFSPSEGKAYLLQKGFTKDQTEAIYYKNNF
jgi:hypothetical protein